MTVNFDEIIDRSNTNAVAKQGFRDYLFGDEETEVVLPCADDDAISMWVADMAFASAPAAIEAMAARLEHPIFGYSALFDDELFDAFNAWCVARYGWSPHRDHFVASGGIVPALFDLVEYITEPEEKILTLTPAYGFFKHAVLHHDRELATCTLVKDTNGTYVVDMAEFERAVSDPKLRMFFLCHPHNPTGRVWAEQELRTMADLCFANDVVVVSDEIHCDLLRSGVTHTPLAKLYPDSDQIITCMSASKTFNLAGLGLAHVLIPNDEHRAIWEDRGSPVVNPVSVAAATGVFRNGAPWLAELTGYLDQNFAVVEGMIAEQLPGASFRIPDATYLAWIGLKGLLPEDINISRFFAESAGVLLEGAEMFVADGDHHIRVNVALPRAVLVEGLERIIDAVKSVDAG